MADTSLGVPCGWDSCTQGTVLLFRIPKKSEWNSNEWGWRAGTKLTGTLRTEGLRLASAPRQSAGEKVWPCLSEILRPLELSTPMHCGEKHSPNGNLGGISLPEEFSFSVYRTSVELWIFLVSSKTREKCKETEWAQSSCRTRVWRSCRKTNVSVQLSCNLFNSVENVGWHQPCNDCVTTGERHNSGFTWCARSAVVLVAPACCGVTATSRAVQGHSWQTKWPQIKLSFHTQWPALNDLGFLKMTNSVILFRALDHLQTNFVCLVLAVEGIRSQTWKGSFAKAGQIMLHPRDWWSAKMWSATFI